MFPSEILIPSSNFDSNNIKSVLTWVSDHAWICISWLVFLSHASPLHPSISCSCMPMVDIMVQTIENEIENIDLLIKVWPLCSHRELSWTGLIITLVGLSAPLSSIDLSYRRPLLPFGLDIHCHSNFWLCAALQYSHKISETLRTSAFFPAPNCPHATEYLWRS